MDRRVHVCNLRLPDRGRGLDSRFAARRVSDPGSRADLARSESLQRGERPVAEAASRDHKGLGEQQRRSAVVERRLVPVVQRANRVQAPLSCGCRWHRDVSGDDWALGCAYALRRQPGRGRAVFRRNRTQSTWDRHLPHQP